MPSWSACLAAAVSFLLTDRTRRPLAQARALLDRFDKQPNVDQAIGLLSAVVVGAARRIPRRARCWQRRIWRKFEYSPSGRTTLAARAGEQAGVALTLDQSYAPVHVVLAMINYSQGRFEGALGEAQKAIALDPGLAARGVSAAAPMFRLGRREEAEKDFLTAVALDPGDWTARNSLGSFYLNLNRLDDAVAEYERMRALAPDNTRAYNNLGSAFLLQERFDKATEMYERSLSLDKNATAYSNLGTALYQQGRYADAARSFEGAVALPGATFLHWFNLGAACYWAPDRRGAREEAYETAVKLGEQARAPRPGSIRSARGAGLRVRGAGAADGRRRKRRSIEAGPQAASRRSSNRRATRACSRRSPPRTRSLAIARRRSTGSSRRSRQGIHSSGSSDPRG